MNVIKVDFFKIENKVKPKAGNFLISEPFSGDSFFNRTVVLLTEHNQNGSVGFILNRPVDINVDEAIQDFPPINSLVSIGGPINTDAIYYLHTLGDKIPNSVHIFGNIYWGGSFKILQHLIKTRKVSGNQVRFFIGYSGWKPNQLKNEIKNNYWLVSDVFFDDIMTNSDHNVWHRTLDKLGTKYKIWANFPADPNFN